MISRSLNKYNLTVLYITIISIVFHIILIYSLYLYLINNNNKTKFSNTEKTLLKNNTFSNPMYSNKSSETHIQTSTQDKIDKIKILEKIDPIYSNKSSETHIQTSTQDKIDKTKQIQNKKHTIPNTEFNTISNVNNLLNNLIESTDINISHNNIFTDSQKNDTLSYYNDSNIINNDILNNFDIYKQIIVNEISNKFYNLSNYSGKQCTIKIILKKNGQLESIIFANGDSDLCQVATDTIKTTKFPILPDQKTYEMFKNITLNFEP